MKQRLVVEIPDELRTLFSAHLEAENEQYVFEVPAGEVDNGTVEVGGDYRIAVLPTETSDQELDTELGRSRGPRSGRDASGDDPPVEEGEQLRVEIDELGDEGDGVALLVGSLSSSAEQCRATDR